MMRRRYSHTRVYSQKKYNNPFFRRRRKKVRQVSLKVKFLIAGIILIIAGLFWFIFYHEYFYIENIMVEGGERIQDYKIYEIVDKQLDKKRLFVFNQSNIFSFSKKQVKNKILEQFLVDDLKINKNLSSTLIISFKEKEPAAVWCENEEYYYIDSKLNIIAKINSLEIDSNSSIILKNIENESQIRKNGIIKKVTIGEEYLKASLLLSQKLKNIQLEINDQETTLSLNIQNGPRVHFNIEEDLEKQFNKLKALVQGKIKNEQINKLQYIDLRFGDKIYYK